MCGDMYVLVEEQGDNRGARSSRSLAQPEGRPRHLSSEAVVKEIVKEEETLRAPQALGPHVLRMTAL